ncbi:unnamed protein product [Adineta steineri]|uniref:Uncharacterized protein n=1 Tax=Adineta steineri TaxID=433720 RepID=A0A814GMH0_9BILA|nr:unnamed protein product [Adineta steineri]CAF3853817.1 unnamed protein product [Adineta steineri]
MWCFLVILLLFNNYVIFAQSIPLLLLVSFDGFRHDYPKLHGPLKNFQRLEQRGVHAQKMISTFATATFPNHYTLITGLYEEVHGIISNNMYDPKTNLTFEQSDNMTNNEWWPYPTIWSINEQRKGGRSGVVGWPQDSIHISKYQPFNRSRSFRDIIDQMLLWFNDLNEPINFGAMYFYEPDRTGHQTGPYSKNMTTMVRECDELLGYLLDKIDTNEKLRKNLHLIVTSDHGMEQINGTNNPIYLEDYVDHTKIRSFGVPPVTNIFVLSSNDIDIVLKNLSRIPHSQSYKRQDIPERYHYKNHERIGDIVVICEPGYEISHHPSRGGKKYNSSLIHGNHGYDNQVDSMKTIFYASGPQFKQNFTLDNSSSLYNIDLFGLMCIILNIDKCPSSNGSLENIQPFLINPTKTFHMINNLQDKIIYAIALFGIISVILLAITWTIIAFRSIFVVKQQTSSDLSDHLTRGEYQVNNPGISKTKDEQV